MGDEVEFDAFDLTYPEAMEHGGTCGDNARLLGTLLGGGGDIRNRV